MREVISTLAAIVNYFHDLLIAMLGHRFTDVELHFWVIGIIGILIFLPVYALFKLIEKMKEKMMILAFIYTFTIVVIVVFAIEIQQAITKRGNMEFSDAIAGLYGFLAFFFAYLVIFSLVKLIKR